MSKPIVMVKWDKYDVRIDEGKFDVRLHRFGEERGGDPGDKISKDEVSWEI
jgi:hypothetical protein